MTDALTGPRPRIGRASARQLKRRRRAERRFRLYGILAIVAALTVLALLIGNIAVEGYSAFVRAEIRLDVTFDESIIDVDGTRDPEAMRRANYSALVRDALRAYFPEVKVRREVRELLSLVSSGASDVLRQAVLADPAVIGTTRSVWMPASDDVDMFIKGRISADAPEDERRVKDRHIEWLGVLAAEDALRTTFNGDFLASGDSREPELAGVWGAVVGSFLTLIVTLVFAFPMGVMAAVYLEEFAPENRWTNTIEVNVNNLAAVPSIVFGLLGLAFFLGVMHLPRSAPIVGGLTLALMTFPTIIIAGRAALKAVPPSVRDGALAVGASHTQAVLHHILPLAMPGMLTGTIIGMARALGETAPLLMIGMVAFIADIPGGFTDAASVLPVQVFLWADSPERGFVEKTSAAIIVLLVFLVAMNALAVVLRKRFEKRW